MSEQVILINRTGRFAKVALKRWNDEKAKRAYTLEGYREATKEEIEKHFEIKENKDKETSQEVSAKPRKAKKDSTPEEGQGQDSSETESK